MLYNLQDELSRQKFKAMVRKLWDNGHIVELTDKRKRTRNQNNYLHVAIGALAVETGNSLEFIKQEVFKRRVNPDLFIEEKEDPILGHLEVLRSSRELTKEQMSVAIDRFRKFCEEQGVYIPSPGDDALIEQMEWEISKVERYL